MKVVIDSTEIIADYRFQGNGFRILFGSVSLLGMELIIPQVVIDEVHHKYAEELLALEEKVHSVATNSSRILSIPLRPSLISSDYEIASYKALFEKTIQENNITVLPYPEVAHKTLVSRDLAHRKPFDNKGRGYRDALIWESILELLKSDQIPVAFITGNTSDFGEGPHLHEDLRADIGSTTDSFRLFRSLNDFNHSVALPQLETLDDLKDKMNHDCLPEFSLKSWLRKHLGELDWDVSALTSPVKHDHAIVHIKSVSDIDSVIVNSIHGLSPQMVLVSASANISCTLSICVTWDDYCQHEDVRDLLGNVDEPFELTDISYPITATFLLSLIFNEDSNEVVSAEVDRVEGGSKRSEIWRLRSDLSTGDYSL